MADTPGQQACCPQTFRCSHPASYQGGTTGGQVKALQDTKIFHGSYMGLHVPLRRLQLLREATRGKAVGVGGGRPTIRPAHPISHRGMLLAVGRVRQGTQGTL